MKKNEFSILKPGMKLYRRMDVGQIIRTIERAYVSDYGLQFIFFKGDKEPRRWDGIHKHYHLFVEVKSET